VPNFTEHLRELAARQPPPAKETTMDFGPVPPSKEVQATMDGVIGIMERSKENLVRQIKLRHIELNSVDLAHLENDVHLVLMHLLKEHNGGV
jgi:hypothetical protein